MAGTRDTDRQFMRRAVALARRAEGRTSPNPIVGCIVVGRGGRILAEDWHRQAGLLHAEAAALGQLMDRAPGATVFVTLEPCVHTGPRRTAPCVPLLASSGIARLVYGMRDPFDGHGGGLDVLRRAGIQVDGPVEEDLCLRANEAFVVYGREGRAHFTLKAAMSLDGRIATVRGESRWITGEIARRDVHRRRDKADAVLVGVGTVIADDPLLTVRGVRGARDPIRIVLDGRLALPPGARLLASGSRAQTIVATTREAAPRRARALEAAGAEIWRLPGKGGLVDLRSLGRRLAQRGIIRILVEGGAETHAGFLAAGLCDRLLLYVAPMAIGGRRAPAWLGGADLLRLAGAARFRFDGAPRKLGDDFLLAAVPVKKSSQI